MGLFSSELSAKQMVPFCRQLAATYTAGIPIAQSLDVVGAQLTNKAIRTLTSEMKEDILRGATLADAAAAQSKRLPRFFVQLVAAGERGGRLDAMLRDLAKYYEDKVALQRTIAMSLLYPGIQLAFAWFAGSFALTTIGRINTTSFDLNGILRDYAALQASAGAVAAVALVAMAVLARTGQLRRVTGVIGTHAWPFSGATLRFALARFFRSMALLVGSGVNIVKCVEASAEVAHNDYVKRHLLRATPVLRNGGTLEQAFAPIRIIPPMAQQMVAVGERAGELEFQMEKIAQWYTEEAESKVLVITRVMNVVILLLVAVVVAYVLITFYSRLYGGIYNELGI